jgi:uncharacterized protein (TIGR03083 family)
MGGETRAHGMDTGAIEAAVRHERLALCDHLDGLDDAGWATPSLCTEWTVREVVAHLTTTTRSTVGSVLRAAVRARGSFDRMEVQVARERSERFTPAELLGQLRESAASSRRTPGSGPMDPLMDLVVHAQDVSRPLGRPYRSPDAVVLASLAYVAGNRFLGGSRRAAGLELVATDADWSSGAGPQVRGPAEDLLLVVAGRPAGLAALDGPGVAALADRLR